MSDNFEDTRNSIIELLNFFDSEALNENLVNRDFEKLVKQIINKKSNYNFKLFIYSFDEIYFNNITTFDSFIDYFNKELEKNSKLDRFAKLFKEINNQEERKSTINFAITVYKSYNELVGKYREEYKQSIEMIDNYENMKTRKDFDIFLSHRYYLRFYNIIVYYVLTAYLGLDVYVDWIFDRQVNRKNLTKNTVDLLRKRMEQSRKLLFFNILNSKTTNWMAWEVGYFSCLRDNSIGILDLDGYCTGNKNVEVLSSNDVVEYKNGGLYVRNSISINDWINEV